jgi:hypothetical protein
LSDKINSVTCASSCNGILQYFDYYQDSRYVRKKMRDINCSLEGVWPNPFSSGREKKGASIFIVQKLITEQNLAKNQKLASAKYEYVRTIAVSARSKVWVCSRLLAGVVGSNPAGGNGCLSFVSVVCCTGNGLCGGTFHRPEESYRV